MYHNKPSFLSRGNITCLQNARTPFSVTLPSSQNAFATLRVTLAALSKRSILLSSSEELIFPPVNPGTKQDTGKS